jgi:hypothetical protein
MANIYRSGNSGAEREICFVGNPQKADSSRKVRAMEQSSSGKHRPRNDKRCEFCAL